MPFATVTGVRSSCEMFARKSAFAVEPAETSSFSPESSVSSSRMRPVIAASSSPSTIAATGDSTTAPPPTERTADTTASCGSAFVKNAEAPAPSAAATRSASAKALRATIFVVGDVARRRRINSPGASPSRSGSHTTTSGRPRTTASTARTASVVTSTRRSGASRSRWYCRSETSSGASQSRTVVGMYRGYRLSPDWIEGRAKRVTSVHDAGADRDRHGLGAVVRPELLEDALEVGLHGVRRDAEVRRDLTGRRAVGDLLEDLALALRERRRLRFTGRRAALAHPCFFDEG